MADTFTANYNFTKPEVAGSRDAWGTKDNANWDALDGLLKALSDGKVAGAIVGSVRTVTESINFTGPFKNNNVDVATQDWVNAAIKTAINLALPSTLIALHRGTVASIPAGWVLCDGANGTVDLRDKFIVGAGTTYAPGNQGGTITHNHGGVTGDTAISVAQMPNHSHSVNDPTHAHGLYDPGHIHGYVYVARVATGGGTGLYGSSFTGLQDQVTATDNRTTGISINGAATGISINATGGSAPHNHGLSASDHRPPYYALCFIQRVPIP